MTEEIKTGGHAENAKALGVVNKRVDSNYAVLWYTDGTTKYMSKGHVKMPVSVELSLGEAGKAAFKKATDWLNGAASLTALSAAVALTMAF